MGGDGWLAWVIVIFVAASNVLYKGQWEEATFVLCDLASAAALQVVDTEMARTDEAYRTPGTRE